MMGGASAQIARFLQVVVVVVVVLRRHIRLHLDTVYSISVPVVKNSIGVVSGAAPLRLVLQDAHGAALQTEPPAGSGRWGRVTRQPEETIDPPANET